MKVIAKIGNDELANVYVAQSDSGKLLEFVESVPSPFTIDEKWVLIISTLYGCPIKCRFCDAGNFYSGKPPIDELIYQIASMLRSNRKLTQPWRQYVNPDEVCTGSSIMPAF